MAVLRTCWSLCLNDQMVPAQTKVCSIVDPYKLTEGLDLDLEETEVSLVRFHGTADMSWLMKSLEMPVKWWIHEEQERTCEPQVPGGRADSGEDPLRCERHSHHDPRAPHRSGRRAARIA